MTTPTAWKPKICGGSAASGNVPDRSAISGYSTGIASVLIVSSPAPGRGVGISRGTSTSGPPVRVITIARIENSIS
ncbi:hypothetical protein OG225_22195 [Nocardia sp. NBC_01377]|uniref:hypothetical protein n=1 Tax=Nocardia sp. NBC_01377 TaxID=2903595 RepID=UPI00324F64C8